MSIASSSTTSRASVTSREQDQQRLITISLLILAGVASGVSLYLMRSVLLPFAFAALIAILLSPLIAAFEVKLRLPRGVAVLLAFAIALLVMSGFGVIIVRSIASLATDLEEYKTRLIDLSTSLRATLTAYGLPDSLISFDQSMITARLAQLPFVSWISGTASFALSLLGTIALVIVFTAYLLVGTSSMPGSHPSSGALGNIVCQTRSYLYTKFMTSTVTGMLTGIILFVLRIKLAGLFALFSFLLNFIPNIGSGIAVLLPIPILLAEDVGMVRAALAIALPTIVQITVGNVVEPRLMGEGTDLHPITILLALLFWGVIWGVGGMILSVPITAAIKLVFERSPTTAIIAHLMAGRLPIGEHHTK